MKTNKKNNKITHVKLVRKADREIALSNDTFHQWFEKPKVHTNKKKKANKLASRNFKNKSSEE
jgi:hypothetical protein